MYFKFFISESWGKRAAIARSRFIQSFLNSMRIIMRREYVIFFFKITYSTAPQGDVFAIKWNISIAK